MKKTIRYVICEGKKAQTEKNFLKGYEADVDFIKIVNDQNDKTARISNYLKSNNKLIFCIETIAYNKLETYLDANSQQTYLIIYVDNDNLPAISYVKKIADNNNIKDDFNMKNNNILVYPSIEKGFEELLSCFFEKPNQIYKDDKNISKLKDYLGDNFKSDSKIYKLVATQKGKNNFIKNMKRYHTKRIFNLLRIKI